MFIDLVGSTALSGRLDPEEMGELLRAFQGAVTGEIAPFDGRAAKFMGDGVLAYFGWPRAHEDEAERSVRAGLAISKAVAALSLASRRPCSRRWRRGPTTTLAINARRIIPTARCGR